MKLAPISMNIVNWKAFIQAAKSEQGKDVTAYLDRAGLSLDKPSSFIAAIGNLDSNVYSDRFLHHLYYAFYFSLDETLVFDMSTLTDLNITNFEGHGVVSGTFLQWRDGITSMLGYDNVSNLAVELFKVFERAGLDKYFSKETRYVIRAKNQVAGRKA